MVDYRLSLVWGFPFFIVLHMVDSVFYHFYPHCVIHYRLLASMGLVQAHPNPFYVANKSRESETSAYSNLYAFVCYFIFQSAKNNTISRTHLHIYRNSYIAV